MLLLVCPLIKVKNVLIERSQLIWGHSDCVWPSLHVKSFEEEMVCKVHGFCLFIALTSVHVCPCPPLLFRSRPPLSFISVSTLTPSQFILYTVVARMVFLKWNMWHGSIMTLSSWNLPMVVAPQLMMVVITQLCASSKIHRTLFTKTVAFSVWKLYLNKTDFKNLQWQSLLSR